MLYMSVYFYAIHAAEPEAATTICFVSSEHQIIQAMIQLAILMNIVVYCVD